MFSRSNNFNSLEMLSILQIFTQRLCILMTTCSVSVQVCEENLPAGITTANCISNKVKYRISHKLLPLSQEETVFAWSREAYTCEL